MLTRKIMVVDDERAIINLLKQLFSNEGYLVFTAENGKDAIQIMEEESICVMFLDLSMPDMTGIDLCRIIKKQMPMSVVYAITGYASLFQLAECREAGFEDYFKKPLVIPLLLEKAKIAFEKLERWKSL